MGMAIVPTKGGLTMAYNIERDRESKDLTAIKTKYDAILKKLHTCTPSEKAGMTELLNYYYNLLN